MESIPEVKGSGTVWPPRPLFRGKSPDAANGSAPWPQPNGLQGIKNKEGNGSTRVPKCEGYVEGAFTGEGTSPTYRPPRFMNVIGG